MEKQLQTPSSVTTFGDIIGGNGIYVDKTIFLSYMLESAEKTWFLARPRRFGKSVTVSTLAALFSSETRSLFTKLAIGGRLEEERFAPRPVIRLDLSGVATHGGPSGVDHSLMSKLNNAALNLKIKVPKEKFASDFLASLITRTKIEKGIRPAILIDEYDAPVTSLWEYPAKAEAVRKVLRTFYAQIKACDEDISFVYVTGITKFIHNGLFSAFNNQVDISFDLKFGTIAGFTHSEIEANYNDQLKQIAKDKKMSLKSLLVNIKNYYNGYCFDGKNLVYNQFSFVSFIKSGNIKNYWFDSGTPELLVSYLKQNKLIVEDFHGINIAQDAIINPRLGPNPDPIGFLYQMGYLSIHPDMSQEEFKLDYPNYEVRESMAKRIIESYFNDPHYTHDLFKKVSNALINRKPYDLIDEFNNLLSATPYEYFYEHGNNKSSVKSISNGNIKAIDKKCLRKRNEGFYNAIFRTLFYGLGLKCRSQEHGNLGRSELIIDYNSQIWVIELKICHKKDNDNSIAEAALEQIKSMNYTGRYKNPVLLGIAINDEKRIIKSWRSIGGKDK
jgi:hypothetical protein